MSAWSLDRGDPLSLEIACDAHLVHPDFGNDQIWELRLEGGEPAAMAVETTFGLRARQMRVFPRFCENGIWLSDPHEFSRLPAVTRIYPNFLSTSCSPFPSLDVISDYWVPESHVLAGRLQLCNPGQTKREFILEWTAILQPHVDGESMAAWQQVVSPVLRGKAEDLYPVLFLTGGPEEGSGPFASLVLRSPLEPGESRVIHWAIASLTNTSDSFELARQVTARPWEAEIARIEREWAQRTVVISSGRSDWEAAFGLSQKTARGLIMGPEYGLPQPSFVSARRPDCGYSQRGDGSDYQSLWNGQTALEAWFLSTQALPVELELRRGLLENFLSAAGAAGSLDMKPGMAGQRSRFLASPFLCQIAWSAYEAKPDKRWLSGVFPGLQEFLEAWFSPERDRDGDGLPEWDSLMQMDFEDHPTFSRAEYGGDGVDISTAEDPALLALLVLECRALANMADVLDQTQAAGKLQKRIEMLTRGIQDCWGEERGVFLLRDRDTHLSSPGRVITSFSGTGRSPIECPDCLPSRLLIHLKAATENTRSPRVILRGAWHEKEIQEEILARSVFWVHNQAWITSEHAFTRLDEVEVRGLDPRDEVIVHAGAFDRQNLTLFLPLLAGVCKPEQASSLAGCLASPEQYDLPFGMPASPYAGGDGQNCLRTSVPWSTLIISGLHHCGFHEEAAELFNHLMAGILANLRNEQRFQAHSSALTGQSGGDANVLQGLVPLGLYLELAGLTIYSPWRVLISDNCPLPGPITVQYQGMQIQRTAEETLVRFPDGQHTAVPLQGTHMVSLADH